ncbi:MAG: hypothetical protein ACI9WH_001484, partial [Glaciecola sp.]
MSEQSISSAQALSSIQQCIQQGHFDKAQLDAKRLLAAQIDEET